MSFTFTARHSIDVTDVVWSMIWLCSWGGGGGGGGEGLLMVDLVQIPVV